jgi:hypothetical protein
MKKLVLAIAASLALPVPAQAAVPPPGATLHIAGDFNGWNAGVDLMTETSPGIWQIDLSLSLGRHEFKVVDTTFFDPNWMPDGGNSWLYTDGSGHVTISYDANTYSDGWRGDGGRIGLSTDPGTWTAVGDWQAWNIVGNSMTAQGAGIYKYSAVIGTAGWYQYMAVVTGSLDDAIGDDFRHAYPNTLWFQTTAPNQTVDFLVDAFKGTIKVDVIPVPEPPTFALLGLGLAGFLCFRRRS